MPSTMKLEIDIMEQKGSFAIVLCNGKTVLRRFPQMVRQKFTYQRDRKMVKSYRGGVFDD